MRVAVVSLLLAVLPVFVLADHHSDSYYHRDYWREPLIVVDTRNCAGESGLASFRAERVFKVQAGICQDPDDSRKKLYQVMLKSLTGGTDYEILWVDEAGMQDIRTQLRENREAALRRHD
ncbi:MAG: hypothetical protein KJO31_16540 [Gammaproteobacteria bacterium]|nr:hypothetical protein [Gammaproteobacteria bacterium]